MMTDREKASIAALEKHLAFVEKANMHSEYLKTFLDKNLAVPEQREEYLSRCQKLSDNCYQLLFNPELNVSEQQIFVKDRIADIYNTVAKNYAPIVEAAMPFLRENYKLWDDLIFVFAPEPLGGEGVTNPLLHVIEIDLASRTPDDEAQFENFCETILHECTHIEQRISGTLTSGEKANLWHGQQVQEPTQEELEGSEDQYNKYLALPWEVEARERSEKLHPAFKDFLLNKQKIIVPPEVSYDHLGELQKTNVMALLAKVIFGGNLARHSD